MLKCLVVHKDLSTFDADKVRKAWEGRHHNPIWWWRVHGHYGIKVIEIDVRSDLEVVAMARDIFDMWRGRHVQS